MSEDDRREFNQILADTMMVLNRTRHLIEEGFNPETALMLACEEDHNKRQQQSGWL